MTKLITKTIGGLVAAAALVAAASPAEARHRRHHNNSGAVISAGIIGLGLGAAIASSNRGYYGRGYYDPYYRNYDPYYGPAYYPPRGYYRHRPYRRHCVTRRVWDPYWGRRVKVRYC
jgi:hypothetical protein